MTSKSVFTTQDVAQLLNASRTSVQRWVDEGSLKAFVTPGGHRRVTRAELVKFMRGAGMPIPSALQSRLRLLAVGVTPGLTRELKALRRELDFDAADDALAALLRLGAEAFDVLLMVEPEDGALGPAAVAEGLRRRGDGTRVVAIAKKSNRTQASRLIASGVVAVVGEPPDARDIRAALERAGLLEAEDETTWL